jgi:hypothetical protein
VIRALHKKRFVEYDTDTETVIISPLGLKHVEEVVLPKLDT